MFLVYSGSSVYPFPLLLSPYITVKQEQLPLQKYLLDTRFFDPLNFIDCWQSKHNSFNLSAYAKFLSTMIILFPPKWICFNFPVPLKTFKNPFECENVIRFSPVS